MNFHQVKFDFNDAMRTVLELLGLLYYEARFQSAVLEGPSVSFTDRATGPPYPTKRA